jgi:hypothetical protein
MLVAIFHIKRQETMTSQLIESSQPSIEPVLNQVGP